MRALRFYNEEGWSTMAQFVAFTVDIWKVLDVKFLNEGNYNNIIYEICALIFTPIVA